MSEYYVYIPLFPDPNYEMIVSLERTAYKIRAYYNERMQAWIMDLRYVDNTPLVLGQRIVPNYPLMLDYDLPLTGYFWLEAIGDNINETVSNPFELNQYYRLYYIYEEED
jgi:hypothetical protein